MLQHAETDCREASALFSSLLSFTEIFTAEPVNTLASMSMKAFLSSPRCDHRLPAPTTR